MSMYALVRMYGKFSQTINDCVIAQNSCMDHSALRINNMLKEMQKSNRWQAGMHLATGLLGGMGNVVASALQNVNNPFAKAAQLIVPILPKGGEFFLTLERGNESRLHALNSMERDFRLTYQRELSSALSGSDKEIDQKIRQIQELKAAGDRLH